MSIGEYSFIVLSILAIMGTFLPIFRLTHWSVRGFDFLRIQVLGLLLILLPIGVYLFQEEPELQYILLLSIVIAIVFQLKVIFPYLAFRRTSFQKEPASGISVISANVLQSNTNYASLLSLLKQQQPDIVLTLESDMKWEGALKEIETLYPNREKIPKDNTYGMHFYTKLEVEEIKVHYFLTEERPAIEALLKDKEGRPFVFWGVHPPPPSPTEEPSSKEKDSELMSIAKAVRKKPYPHFVIGDFNNVCWSGISKLFAKAAQLEDARIGRGLYSTFPVRPKWLRFPIDLLFHSQEIQIHTIRTLGEIGSDHLPVCANFSVTTKEEIKVEPMKAELKEKVEGIIEEGEELVEEKD
jgi:endonuclease/exonuclease/phosphatase (EEP) superfamily protein YafD